MNLLEFPLRPSNLMIPDEEYDQMMPQGQSRLNSAGFGSVGSQSTGNLRSRALNSAKPLGQKPLIRQAENLDENRVVLYKRSKQLG